MLPVESVLGDEAVVDGIPSGQEGPVVIRILGLHDRTPTAYDGRWLTEYDPSRTGISPDGHPMRAHLAATGDKALARRFATLAEVQQCALQTAPPGVRQDGRPDRPLTAFTIMIEPADD